MAKLLTADVLAQMAMLGRCSQHQGDSPFGFAQQMDVLFRIAADGADGNAWALALPFCFLLSFRWVAGGLQPARWVKSALQTVALRGADPRTP